MKAYLIDPDEKSVVPVEWSGDYKQIYDLTDCSTFDCVYIDRRNAIFFDDEGLLKIKDTSAGVWSFGRWGPVTGKGLCIGINEEDNDDVNISLEDLKAGLTFSTVKEGRSANPDFGFSRVYSFGVDGVELVHEQDLLKGVNDDEREEV